MRGYFDKNRIESYVLCTCMISSLANMHGYFDESKIEWTCMISSLANMHGYFDESNRAIRTMDLYDLLEVGKE